MAKKYLKITLKRSLIGKKPKHRAIVRSLGLRKLNHTVYHFNRPEIRGMVKKVIYLLDVEEVDEKNIMEG